MLAKYLSGIWSAIAPAVGNHLWQSTLFAIVAGLLTLALRKNRAQARYSVWLAASVKFLVPFSVLAAMGSHLRWSRDPAMPKAGLAFAMQQVGQPFLQPTMTTLSPAIPSTILGSLLHLLPALLAVWLCGFLMVVFVWLVRWRRISAATRKAKPLREGREIEALRRLEHVGGIRKPTEIVLSEAPLEPGIFGIVRPVLVWPERITERLADAHLEAILAHELSHIRRRDNLAAAIHMLVEAIFWFHPLVWWLGARLVAERERACDEAVLESGRERQVYAESILKICELCVESPLTCVSGVTGSDLNKRVVRIMREPVARKLDFSKTMLLAAVGLLAFALPIVTGSLNAERPAEVRAQDRDDITPAYEVASVKLNEAGTASLKTGKGIVMQNMLFAPSTFTAQNTTLQELIRAAYGVADYQISGAPDWLTSELFDVDAKADKSVLESMQKLGDDQRELKNRRMLQTLLKDRFKLTLRQVNRDLPIYSLVVDEPGKLHEAQGDCGPGPNLVLVTPGTPLPSPCGSLRVFPWVGHMDGKKVPIKELVSKLSGFTRRMVLDRTNLAGRYDIDMKWLPGPSDFPPRPAYLPADYQPDPHSLPLLAAIQHQLGLKLESQAGPVPLLIIDHVEGPSGN
jgi:uncharacterized protein (TIGR03435 family)